jgi:TonB family protein
MATIVPRSLFIERRRPMKKFVVGSAIGHVALLVTVIVYQMLDLQPRVNLDKPIIATLVRKGKERDEQLLPRKEELPPPPQEVKAPEAPPAPEPPKPEKAAVPVPIPTLPPAPKQQTKQQGEKDAAERRKKLFGAFDRNSKATKVEELEGKADGDEMGDSARAEGERYYALLKSQIQRHYDVAQTISEAERRMLRANVEISVARTGKLQRKPKLVKSSGNSLFDQAVLAAIERSAPFSPPPEKLRRDVEDGVTLQFTP